MLYSFYVDTSYKNEIWIVFTWPLPGGEWWRIMWHHWPYEHKYYVWGPSGNTHPYSILCCFETSFHDYHVLYTHPTLSSTRHAYLPWSLWLVTQWRIKHQPSSYMHHWILHSAQWTPGSDKYRADTKWRLDMIVHFAVLYYHKLNVATCKVLPNQCHSIAYWDTCIEKWIFIDTICWEVQKAIMIWKVAILSLGWG